ncbi:tyrosine-type recombinase/integrase [Neobacillus sp. OS1-32]|uniref:tyrosine-type recombinase/integrase n=1 Tax=Neobacillus sp. OS1-32 TaxID=3070682 RepID=UPI0027E106BC|nr:tyrosine-type recombinase/integrase [Neobacillus sp. OS1-32]WML29210.1 tyrosine-type recombinase/integrase [Neobacillus sp. OS1-32]
MILLTPIMSPLVNIYPLYKYGIYLKPKITPSIHGALQTLKLKTLMKFVRNRMARLLKLSELNPTLTPHSFRHTHTFLLAQAGIAINEIMDRLGHQDDLTTRRIYLHGIEYRRKNASDQFSALIRSYRK